MLNNQMLQKYILMNYVSNKDNNYHKKKREVWFPLYGSLSDLSEQELFTESATDLYLSP